MFKKQYNFYGKHAAYVKKLTAKISISGVEFTNIFNRNIDVLLFAGIIGIVYGKRSELDRSKNSMNEVENTGIFSETIISNSEKLNYIYEVIMLLHDKQNIDKETRIDRAFKYYNKSEEFKKQCYDIYNSYVLGGIEILYEKIIGNGTEIEEYMENLYEFLDEFNMKFNIIKGDEDIKDLYL